jgi:hypothetical protein
MPNIPIAVKTSTTTNGKGRSFNAAPKIRNGDYVITLPSLLDSLNLQSNKGSYQRGLERISIAIKGLKPSFQGLLFLLFEAVKAFIRVLKESAIAQPKGHTPFLISRYVSLSGLGFGDRLRHHRAVSRGSDRQEGTRLLDENEIALLRFISVSCSPRRLVSSILPYIL